MKRVWTLIAIVLFLGASQAPLSFAQGMGGMMGDEPMMEESPMMEQGSMEEHKMKDHGKMMKKAMMMEHMMKKSIVATSDGGVIVLAGNKLMKYDKNLALVKEVEIKVDMEAMHKSMKEMMKYCPVMKGSMMGKQKDESAQNDQTESATEETK